MSMSQFGKVAVQFGGESAEREVSLNSGKAVLESLQKQGVDAHAFDPKGQDVHLISEQNFDRVFIVLHGRGGEDGSLQGALNYMGMPFTGSGAKGSAIAMDKVRSKYLFLGSNKTYYREVEKHIHNYPDHGIITYNDKFINPKLNEAHDH